MVISLQVVEKGNAFSKSTEATEGTAELARQVALEQSLKGRRRVEHALRKLHEGTVAYVTAVGKRLTQPG